MNEADVKSILEKIEDCDFEGAISEMYRLARQYAEKGEPGHSDFLSNFAFNSYQSDDLQQQTKPYSEIKATLESIDVEFQKAVEKENLLISEIFKYFQEFEAIATTEQPTRPRFSVFNSGSRDNYTFIARFMEGDEALITPKNVVEIFTNQLRFYGSLQVAGSRTLGNYGGRITNILPGKFWRYVELRKNVKSIKASLNELSEITLQIDKLSEDAEFLRGHYWINDRSSSNYEAYFLKSLKDYREQSNQDTRSPAVR